VVRRIVFLAVTALSLASCSSGADKEWYKPGGTYTMADFDRDRTDCTKNKVLDEECLKDRGWIAISADKDQGVAPMKGGSQTPNDRTRYAPK